MRDKSMIAVDASEKLLVDSRELDGRGYWLVGNTDYLFVLLMSKVGETIIDNVRSHVTIYR